MSSTKRNLEQMEIGGGNTSPPQSRPSQSKKWCFTYNNYPEDAMEQMETVFQMFNLNYVVGRETGESGTRHLQGFIESTKKFRWTELKLPKQIHWEKCKGTRADNVRYCSKDGDFVTNMKLPRQLKLITPDRDWEIQILKEIEQEPDDRTIHWIWSDQGCMGKTSFCKYLVAKHGACVLHGKGADIRHGLAQWIQDKGQFPDVVVYPIPRCFNKEYLSYEGLENIKDMFFYSGKYEGGQVCGPNPHLYVFANVEPDMRKMSSDRWVITCIDGSPGPSGGLIEDWCMTDGAAGGATS